MQTYNHDRVNVPRGIFIKIMRIMCLESLIRARKAIIIRILFVTKSRLRKSRILIPNAIGAIVLEKQKTVPIYSLPLYPSQLEGHENSFEPARRPEGD